MGAPGVVVTVFVLFTMTTMACAFRAATDPDRICRTSSTLHLVASLVMLAMPWAWFTAVPSAAPIALFTAAASWYVYLALFAGPPTAVARPRPQHHESVSVLAYHALMMLGMAWMALAMTSNLPIIEGSSMAGMSSHTDSSMSGMSGMSSGSSAPSMDLSQMTGGQAWALPITWALGLVFCAAAAVFAVRFIHLVGTAIQWSEKMAATAIDSAIDVVMAAGMAVMLLVTLT